MTFVDKLQKHAALLKLAQKDIAHELGDLNPTTVNRWFKGKAKPSFDEGFALARLLDVSLDYLADDDLDEPPPQAPVDNFTRAERVIIDYCRASNLGLDEAMRRLIGRDES